MPSEMEYSLWSLRWTKRAITCEFYDPRRPDRSRTGTGLAFAYRPARSAS